MIVLSGRTVAERCGELRRGATVCHRCPLVFTRLLARVQMRISRARFRSRTHHERFSPRPPGPGRPP
jgi:hypothetical protein